MHLLGRTVGSSVFLEVCTHARFCEMPNSTDFAYALHSCDRRNQFSSYSRWSKDINHNGVQSTTSAEESLNLSMRASRQGAVARPFSLPIGNYSPSTMQSLFNAIYFYTWPIIRWSVESTSMLGTSRFQSGLLNASNVLPQMPSTSSPWKLIRE